TKKADLAWPFVPPLGSLKEARAVLDEEHHRVLAPMADKKAAFVVVLIMSLLFGVLLAPDDPFLSQVREIAHLFFYNDANILTFVKFTVTAHVAEATLAVVLARRLQLRFPAVVSWAVYCFFVGLASLKPLAELAFADASE
ncbi:hypothetical protein M885DRAFT_506361, partial [Pelagophyceae sp. CCMP2097]